MAEGRSNSAIAGILVISERGVEKHVGNIFSKLGLACRTPTTAGCWPSSATWSPDRPLPGVLTGDTAGTDLTHHARSPVLGYGTTAAGSLPLLSCTGSWGIGGTSGIASGAPPGISASAVTAT